MILALAAAQDMAIHQLNVVTAFLSALLDVDIYLYLSTGKVVCLLHLIYGLKQSLQ
ncbi:hypothetical protein L873DRAFT_569106 [Choiromyces venosus 120613-1]|uniref:Reverse transcriptase Ty1/copia-type domain-containing protein n=1 Tax=Choiromyces venosus 120613-1 TaxID=1336337 RepID=A0A3N4JUF1_9PEZI|nr:hypothetical protein L873DRAFT_569106 [Choiromyces venosus 120613-1]